MRALSAHGGGMLDKAVESSGSLRKIFAIADFFRSFLRFPAPIFLRCMQH